jgi:TolA-binding protein
MESRQSGLTDLGSNVRDALEREGDATEAIRLAREALLDRASAGNLGRRPQMNAWLRGRSARPRRFLLAVGLAVGASAAAGAWLLVGLRAPVSFRVGPGGAPGRLGDLVEASAAGPVSVQFSEGSSIVVRASSRLRVLAVEPVGAQVLLESGTADVAITHQMQRRTSWRFEAGPFHVQVSGTRFSVGWSTKDQTFALDLKEGSVLVSGACLPAPRTVGAGESMRLACPPDGAAAVAAASPAARVAAAAIQPAAAAAPAAPPPPLAPRAPETPTTPTVERGPAAAAPVAVRAVVRPDWRQLAKAGQYAEAVRAAERVGFDHTCQTASEGELLALADAARLSGRPARAVSALGMLRQRFPRGDAAATAAFALGRISFERGGAYDSAVRWFSTYVSERPSGPLVGDAFGRLMEARQRAGDREGARQDAERYIRRFPEGPYASVARAILAE